MASHHHIGMVIEEYDSSQTTSLSPSALLSTDPSSNLSKPDDTKKDKLAFFVYGLINNFVYIVFLSAAHDIIRGSGSSVSEGSVLLADILPSLCVKTLSPYIMHRISYGFRVWLCSLLSFSSLLLVALVPSFNFQILGIYI